MVSLASHTYMLGEYVRNTIPDYVWLVTQEVAYITLNLTKIPHSNNFS